HAADVPHRRVGILADGDDEPGRLEEMVLGVLPRAAGAAVEQRVVLGPAEPLVLERPELPLRGVTLGLDARQRRGGGRGARARLVRRARRGEAGERHGQSPDDDHGAPWLPDVGATLAPLSSVTTSVWPLTDA